MRIKTRLWISVALSLVMAVMIGALLFMALQKMHHESKEAIVAAQIVKDMAELKIVAQEFLMQPGERPLRQWKLQYDSLTTLLKNAADTFDSLDEKIAIQKTVRDLARFETVFRRLTSGFNREGGIGEADRAISSALWDRLTAELLVRSQATLSPVFQLQQFVQTELVTDQQRASRLIVIFLVVLAVFIIAIFLWINRSIGTPLATLEKGAQIIGSGNLDHKVGITATDEIGQLSRAFDQMTDDLKKTTASIADLNQEIADRRRAEAALASEKEQIMVTLRSIGDGVITSDAEANVTLINKVAEELTGWNQKDAAGKPVSMVFHIINEMTRKRCENPVEKVLQSGYIQGLANDTVLVSKDGTERIIADSGAPIRDKDGKTFGVVLVFRDLTEKIKIESQLHQAQKMEAIGTLAGGIAHDFNNLLMGMQGRVSLMQVGKDASHPDSEHLQGIEDNVKSAADLTKQLLGFARGGQYEVKPTDLNELLKTSSAMFGRTKKEIKIHKKSQKEIWTVEVDQGQIEQVLLNLYINAWQACPPSRALRQGGRAMSGAGEIYLETENVTLDENYVKPYGVAPGRYVKVSVTDTGIGMDKATRQRVFDPFFTTKEMDRGTGMGLASAYGIIKNHDGIINVYSEKGKGTTFNIYLPSIACAQERQAGLPVTDAESERLSEILRGTETVLLVDDEEMIIDVGQNLLEALGYTVLLAKSGREAIKTYKKNKDKIDMVLLDMIMPQMGGGETYDRLKEIDPDIKVLLSSGYSINGLAKTILAKGCDGFIQKPFSMKDLSQKLREILDNE